MAWWQWAIGIWGFLCLCLWAWTLAATAKRAEKHLLPEPAPDIVPDERAIVINLPQDTKEMIAEKLRRL